MSAALVQLLQEYKEIFAYTVEEMPGIDPAVAVHKLNVDSTVKPWIVHVDGSATQNGSGAGIICESPEGDIYEYAMRFNFQASNNEAEYEALICGIQMSRAGGAADVLVLSDSQLIVSQVKGEYEVKDEAMIRYLEKVRQEAQQLSNFEVKHIPGLKITRQTLYLNWQAQHPATRHVMYSGR
ncbi:uncharacterized protein [Spinacia oleracea]|uniref:RNase H type-1 domain-containing protein n=1 Tax=Spinacia oleracea TaxID=3562 RepID=A0ABM3RQZ1_SPIOL|nr:uncharacterized protein LOC130471769 [Spinacia oleracea]